MYTHKCVVWYGCTIEKPSKLDANTRILLHFGAVDYEAQVWVAGSKVKSTLYTTTCADPFTRLLNILEGMFPFTVILRRMLPKPIPTLFPLWFVLEMDLTT